MKYALPFLILFSFTAQASPLLTVKDRLRLHLWTFGIEEKPLKVKAPQKKELPEELERALQKI